MAVGINCHSQCRCCDGLSRMSKIDLALEAFICCKLSAEIGETDALTAESFTGALLLTGRYVFLFLLGIMSVARLDQIKEALMQVSTKLHSVVLIGMLFIS